MLRGPHGKAKSALLARRAELLRGRCAVGPGDELDELDAALARLEAGTWGDCERCGGPIGRQRLTALPETRTCITCGS